MSTVLVAQSFLSPVVFAATEKPLAQYWEESGASIDDVDYNTFNCYTTEMHFHACMAGLNALGAHLESQVRIIPAKLLNDKDIPQKNELKRFGEAVVVEKIDTEGAMIENVRIFAENKRQETSKIHQAEEDLYKRITKSINEGVDNADLFVDFISMSQEFVAKIKANPKNQGKLAMIAGENETAMREIFDPHAYVLPTAYLKDRDRLADKNFFGVGATMQMLNNKPVFIGLLDGGSAKLSKLIKVNDIVLKVDGKSVEGMNLASVVNLIRGEEGTKVKLLLLRGQTQVEIEITRLKFSVQNVESKVVDHLGAKFGYIKLRSFVDSRACLKISQSIGDLEKQNVKGIIIDVRDDGGGALEQALCIGGLFLGHRPIMGVKDLTNGDESTPVGYFYGTSVEDPYQGIGVQKTKLPLVVLINGNSASASEILSGALQDAAAQKIVKVWVLGERSFGKATVQQIDEITNINRPNLKLSEARTIRRFYQPSGRTNQIVGIQPDLTVPFKPDATEDERFVMREKDVFPNALPPEGAEWKQPRPNEVAKLNACLQKNNLAKKKYEAMKDQESNEEALDYQLLVAEEALLCK